MGGGPAALRRAKGPAGTPPSRHGPHPWVLTSRNHIDPPVGLGSQHGMGRPSLTPPGRRAPGTLCTPPLGTEPPTTRAHPWVPGSRNQADPSSESWDSRNLPSSGSWASWKHANPFPGSCPSPGSSAPEPRRPHSCVPSLAEPGRTVPWVLGLLEPHRFHPWVLHLPACRPAPGSWASCNRPLCWVLGLLKSPRPLPLGPWAPGTS